MHPFHKQFKSTKSNLVIHISFVCEKWLIQVTIVHIKLSCCGMCKSVAWSDHYSSSESNICIHKIWIVSSRAICVMDPVTLPKLSDGVLSMQP